MRRLVRPTLLLLAGMPAIAAAQSSVQISGVVDAALRVDAGTVASKVKSIAGGQREASRLTISGLEDLGGGLRVGFVLESGFAPDTGAGVSNPPGVEPGAMSWGRLAALSIGSDDTGYLSLGRQYTPMWAVSAGPANDPFGAGWLGGISAVYSFAVRASNSLIYTYGYTAKTTLLPAPRKGLGAMLMYAAGEATPSDAGQQIGGNLSYGDGTWWVGYGYNQLKGSSPAVNATAPVSNSPTLKVQTLGGSYQFGFGRVHLGLNTGKNGLTGTGAVDRLNWHVGALIPFANVHTFRFIFGGADDRTAVSADWKTFQVGYGYDLSKRTALYAVAGQNDNSATAAAGFAGAGAAYAPGATARTLAAGIRHVF